MVRADLGDELGDYTYHTLSLSRTAENMSEPSQLLFVLKGQCSKTIFFSEALRTFRSNVKDALTRKSQLVMWNPFCTEDI